MSFRRRGDVVGGRGPVPMASNPMLNRTAAPAGMRTPMTRTGIIPTRGEGHPNISPVSLDQKSKEDVFKHLGLKPSIALSNINCVSTGTKDIDTILIHGGLPVNCSLLIEEDGNTDFSGILLKRYVSQGIVQNRKEGKIVNHCIAVGMESNFGNELPDIYAGNSKERKKKLVREQEGKMSVSNINAGNDLKIAWRYKKDPLAKEDDSISSNASDDSKYPDYNHDFDITSKITPSPGPTEISYIRLDGGYDHVIFEIKKTVERELKDKNKMIRIAIPYMLNPMVYGCEDLVEFHSVVRFLYELRRIINSYTGRITLMASTSSELFEGTNVLCSLENLIFDGVLRLVPFPHELNILMEKVYKTQREKIKQGYVDVYRVPILSGMGLMEKRLKEYSFKNSKSKFHIEQWSIPVEEEDVDEKKNSEF
ncbi:hypothetical protein C6P40_005097 [Pichia californica]|uniref:Elongator complex protein 4 n=1 Tax=Pichia californica TaxID=460514 RepID=A0A9P6WLN8_9ASCO|nr:hypothetical protein C6P42_000642 [[Candida] californica]KAG0689406.1 hypothetical protein C6P40_005097 [[Candida] californica]